jgi:hypothetical protein
MLLDDLTTTAAPAAGSGSAQSHGVAPVVGVAAATEL